MYMGKNVINFVKPALHVTKTCYISLTNSHSFKLQTNKTFSLVQSTQLSGKLSHLKNKHKRKNVHASRLNANGSSSNLLYGLQKFKAVFNFYGK